jgi:hypothetical protein
MDRNDCWSTAVTIFNTAGGMANFDLDYFGQGSGGPYQGPQGSLEPKASVTYFQNGSTCPTVGAGRITSDRPLAVIVKQTCSGGGPQAVYNGFSDGATTVNLPLLMANNSGWLTGIAVQNLGSAATNVTVNYYPPPGYPSRNSETVNNLQPNATAIVFQAGGQWGNTCWVGSARVTASQPIAAIVNESSSDKMSSYNSFADGSDLIVLPNVRNNVSGWISGAQVQTWTTPRQTWKCGLTEVNKRITRLTLMNRSLSCRFQASRPVPRNQ